MWDFPGVLLLINREKKMREMWKRGIDRVVSGAGSRPFGETRICRLCTAKEPVDICVKISQDREVLMIVEEQERERELERDIRI